SDDYSKVVAGPGDDKSYKLIVPHACLMMQIFEGKPSSEISVEYLEVNTKGDVIEQISFPVYMYVFKDLNECKSLMSYEKIPSEIIEYHTPEIDANYHSMEYNDFWGMRYKSNDIGYEIFAYDFASKDDALRYYIKSTGEAQLADKNSHGVKHIGQGEYQVIVIEGTKVYRLISSNMLVDKIDKMLAVVFSGRI
ncbi:MAG: hypothetical protein IJD37_00750, partial [Clostridia bacterium]|nr:hypothetical protein [Clostridia bacterium]